MTDAQVLAGRPHSDGSSAASAFDTAPAHTPPLSYAQNLEDYHLSLAFPGQQNGTYVDIGGGHPVAGSVSFWFYERGWRGLVVEPQDNLAALHRRLRPRDTVANSLVGGQTGIGELFIVDRLHGLSTIVEAYADNARRYGVGVRPLKVPMLTLADLCDAHRMDTIDFMKIDVEGAEADVIAGGDWQRYRPKVVVVEAITPDSGEPAWQAWEGMLLAQGYRFALFDTLNRFYVAEEHPEIMARLPSERAPWDCVTHMYEIGRAGECAWHPDHTLAVRLIEGFLASLPQLPPDLLASFLNRNCRAGENEMTQQSLASDAFLARLGRIACAYDGGLVIEAKAAEDPCCGEAADGGTRVSVASCEDDV